MSKNEVVELETNKEFEPDRPIAAAIVIVTFLLIAFSIFILFYGDPNIHNSIICNLRGTCGS